MFLANFDKANTPQLHAELQARLETQRRIACLGIIVRELLSANVVSVPLRENGLADQSPEMVTTQARPSLDTIVRNARQPLLNFILVSREWHSVGIHCLYAYPILYSNQHACLLLQSLKKSPNDLKNNIRELTLVWDEKMDQDPSTVRLILELSPLMDTPTVTLRHDMTVDKPWMLEALNCPRKLTI